MVSNDAIDSHVLAQSGQRVRPRISALDDEAALEFSALISLRPQPVGMLTPERNCVRSEHVEAVLESLQKHILWLLQKLDVTDKDLTAHIKQSHLWRPKDNLLRGVPGVDRVVATTLLAGYS